MYAMTGKLIVQPGRRNEVVQILNHAAGLVGELPECHMYLVSEDLSNETHVWVFEVWDSRQSHDASLNIEHVRALIAQAKPLLAAAPSGAELQVVGGHGLVN
jgi:quinol monooxygenase YgiN